MEGEWGAGGHCASVCVLDTHSLSVWDSGGVHKKLLEGTEPRVRYEWHLSCSLDQAGPGTHQSQRGLVVCRHGCRPEVSCVGCGDCLFAWAGAVWVRKWPALAPGCPGPPRGVSVCVYCRGVRWLRATGLSLAGKPSMALITTFLSLTQEPRGGPGILPSQGGVWPDGWACLLGRAAPTPAPRTHSLLLLEA